LAEGEPLSLESEGMVAVDNAFTLKGRPDRIDLMADGRLHILDYKTGALPSGKAVFRDERQLLLEAVMARRGAFGGLPGEVGKLTYVRIAADGEEREIAPTDTQLDVIWDDLVQLVADYFDPATPYVARSKHGDVKNEEPYDHLARLGEWQVHDSAAPDDVGDAGAE
jgi:ATP-dependent helicase/nuclease subunit B